jgi:ATP-dependent RNA helicase RhlE
LEKIPVKRQNLLFSATFPHKVQDFALEFLEFPEKVEITPQSTAAETVQQFYYHTPNLATKIKLLDHLLSSEALHRVMVFVKKKETANNIYKYIGRKIEDEVRVIHANKSQNSRINAFDDFRSGKVRVLVTTDVASRGLDIREVSHVINFDVPIIYEDYIHRIGRTGRADREGDAITFANKAELMHLKKIEEIIREQIPERPLPVEIQIPKTEAWERKEIEMEIDRIRKREDPDFKGAFHEKKKKSRTRTKVGKSRRKR